MAPVKKEAQSSRKRKHSGTSCGECRLHKARCDQANPCSRCVSKGVGCVYERHTADPSAVASANADPDEVPERPAKRAADGRTVPEKAGPQSVNPGSNAVIAEQPHGSIAEEVTHLRRRVAELQEQLARAEQRPTVPVQSTGSGPDTASTELLSFYSGWKGALNKSRLSDTAAPTYADREASNLAVSRSRSTGSAGNSVTIDDLQKKLRENIGKCEDVARILDKLDPRTIKSSSSHDGAGWSTFPETTLAPVANCYVSFFEAGGPFRILHIPTFYADYSRFCGTAPTSQTLRHKIALALALGTTVMSEEAREPLEQAAIVAVREAQIWALEHSARNAASLEFVQVQCLLVLAQQLLSVGGDHTWLTMGHLYRNAVHIGLHRDPTCIKELREITVFEAEMRRRLWATVRELNLNAALDTCTFGMPEQDTFVDSPTRQPANVDDHLFKANSVNVPMKEASVVTQTSAQRHILSTLAMRSEVVDILTDHPDQVDRARVVELSELLQEACQKCSKFIPGAIGHETTVFKHNMADLLIRRFLLRLNRFLLKDTGKFPSRSAVSRKICIDAATTLVQPLPSNSFERLVARAGGFFRSRMNDLVSALCGSVLTELVHGKARHSANEQQQPSLQLDFLAIALDAALDQCMERVRHGHTHIRTFLKGSVVLALSDGTPVGSTRRQLMVVAANEALEACYTMMETRKAKLQALQAGQTPQNTYRASKHSALPNNPGPFQDELEEADCQRLGLTVEEYSMQQLL